MSPVQNESNIPVGALLVGKYRVTREIGRGGMAAVYEADHLALTKKVAIKVLASELTGSAVVIERFFREARAAASVKSPHIVDIYDSGKLEDGRPFIAMEMLIGESLYDRMARIRLLDIPTTLRVIEHCAKALTKTHAAGIVHRDIKPENIFIVHADEGEEVVKLLDFGLARFYTPVAGDEKAARLTREGAVFGTPAYMSPEQVRGQRDADHRSDLWALGCVAYECLVGVPVWPMDQGLAMTFAAIITHPLPRPSLARSGLPPAFDAWFAKALERDVAKRFQTARAFSDALAIALARPVGGAAPKLADFDERTVMDAVPQALESAPASAPASGSGPPPSRRPRVRAEEVAALKTAQLPVAAATREKMPREVGATGIGTGAAIPSAKKLPAAEGATSLPSSFFAKKRPTALRYAVSVCMFGAGLSACLYVYIALLAPQVWTPLVTSTTSAGSASASAPEPAAAPDVEPKWAVPIHAGQALFYQGDLAGAHRKFKEASDMGAVAVARTFTDQTRAAASGTGPCRMTMFSHPVLGDKPGSRGRPSVISSKRGPIVFWTDEHERAGHDHAYALTLDDAGRPLTAVRDLTPEGDQVGRVVVFSVGERSILLYSEKSGAEAGVRARWLDDGGRIAGPSSLLGSTRSANIWPSIDKTPEGYLVAWQDERDREGDDIFVRSLTSELQPVGREVRLTDYAPSRGPRFVHARAPSVAVASNSLLVVYRLERESAHIINRLRIPLKASDLARGLDEPTTGQIVGRRDRELGLDVKLVSEDKSNGDAPVIACATEGCFVAWHDEKGGASAALIEPSHGVVVWRKRFALSGGRPALGVSAQGRVMVAFYEKGSVKVGSLTREGVVGISSVARVNAETSRPALAPGRDKGEWYLAWQDLEGAHTEALVGKLSCTN